jgi:hypothetical protein
MVEGQQTTDEERRAKGFALLWHKRGTEGWVAYAARIFGRVRNYFILIPLCAFAVWLLVLVIAPTHPLSSPVDRIAALTQCIERFAPRLRNSNSETADLNGAFQLCYVIIATALRADEQQNRNDNLSFQMSENVVLMWMVVVITTSGVLLAGLQLLASYKLAVMGKGELATGGEVKLDRGSVVVQSSVIGVIILAISFGFFMIFVKDVYSISDTSSVTSSSSQVPVSSDIQPDNIGRGQKKQPQQPKNPDAH